MKKFIAVLMLLTGITGTTIAQQEPALTKTEKTFEMQRSYFKRKFTVDLGKGNKMQVELNDVDDLDRIKNVDSLLRRFLHDIEALKDTLADEASSRRIDYVTEANGKNKIRIQIFKPTGSSFLIDQGEPASLKIEQDTVNFIGVVDYIAKYTLRKPFEDSRYYQLSFFVNQLSDLNSYLDGSLGEKIKTIQKDDRDAKWVKNDKDNKGNWYVRNGDRDIYAKQPGGYIAGRSDYLTPRLSVNIQNYKNYFVPSFSLGAAVILNNGFFKRDIAIAWEPNFFFGQNAQGKLQTFRNDFLTLSYGQGGIKDDNAKKESPFLFSFSFGYLIQRQGDYYEKNSMRLGAGQLSLFEGKTKIEPVLYFTNFFKAVTPGIRFLQSF